ncbi:MAG: sensor histidine kinase [Niabella sp.]|nr:sensor histidine kinase [Niabella sp.]
MRQHILTLIVACIFCGVLQAQSVMFPGRYSDSLQRLALFTKDDSVRSVNYFLLSEYFSYSDTARSKWYLHEGERFAKHNPYLLALDNYYTGFFLYDIDRQVAAAKFLQAEQEFEKLPGRESLKFAAKSWRSYGTLLQYKDNDLGMLDALLNKALPLAQKANDTIFVGSLYHDIGMIFMNQKMYKKAEEFYARAMERLELKPNSLEVLLYALDNRGLNYCYMDSLNKAALIVKRVESILKNYAPSEYNLDFLFTKGVYLRSAGKYPESIQAFQNGIHLADSLQTIPQKFNLLMELQTTYMALADYPASLRILQNAIKTDQYHYLDDRVELSKKLMETYEKLHDLPNAYKWMKSYVGLQDSAHTRDLKNSMFSLETRFRVSEKEKQIALLQAANKEADLRAKNSRLSNIVLMILCLVILLIFTFFIITYRTGRKLALQKEMNFQQQLKEMEQRQQIVVTEALLEGEERERRRIARDLHDGLGGLLAGIKMKLSSHSRNAAIKDQAALEQITGQLDNSVAELRRIARNMMPESLIRFGLQTALKELCESMLSQDIEINFIALDLNDQMDLSKQVVIYRIIQEALANAIRHSKARHIMVQCSQNDDRFYITIEDDGVGFDKTALSNKGIGLTNIENRVKYLNGTMDVLSEPNEGTTINMELNVAA